MMIDTLLDFIVDEAEGQCSYAKKAFCLAVEDEMDTAKKFYEMAQAEKEHKASLHSILDEELERTNRMLSNRGATFPRFLKAKHDEVKEKCQQYSKCADEYLSAYETITGMR